MTISERNKKHIAIVLGLIATLTLIFLLSESVGTGFSSLLIRDKTTNPVIRITWIRLIKDLSFSFFRVTLISLLACFLAVLSGFLMKYKPLIAYFSLPALNFIRHISPFAWFPFAIIWFGLGEKPVLFIMFMTLTFPAIIGVKEIFNEIPKEYYDEAHLSGASTLQTLLYVELPTITIPLLNFFRILWGLGWTAVIAAEMLGTSIGLGYSLLDFRYLLFYNEMLLYIVVMGLCGVLIDWGLHKSVSALRRSISP